MLRKVIWIEKRREQGTLYEVEVNVWEILHIIPVFRREIYYNSLPWVNNTQSRKVLDKEDDSIKQWWSMSFFEVVSIVFQIIGFALVILSLQSLGHQNRLISDTVELTAYNVISERQFEVNSIFLSNDNAILFEYFDCPVSEINCAPINKDDPRFARVISVAFILVDFYQEAIENGVIFNEQGDYSNLIELAHWPEPTFMDWVSGRIRPPVSSGLVTWLNTMKESYQTSPTMCKIIHESSDLYEEYYRILGQRVCVSSGYKP